MKKIVAFILIVIMTLTFCGCGYNKSLVDFTYDFDEAMISLPNGEVIKGAIDSWTDFEDGDQIQVTIEGTTYLTHSSNVLLISH